MNIGSYYINKQQLVIALVLLLGLIVSVYLVLNRQIFKSKASLSNCPFEVSQETNGQQENVECGDATYTTSSLDIFIKPKKPDTQPNAPVDAVISYPTSANYRVQVDSRLGYHIPFRDSSVQIADPEGAKKRILNSWPNANIAGFDTVVNRSRESGWNPAFVIALWMEESGAQGNASGYSAALGCDVNHTVYSGTDIDQQLTCLFNNFSEYPNEQFADFMCRYATGSYKPCDFAGTGHAYFPGTISNVYSELVPSGRGALVR